MSYYMVSWATYVDADNPLDAVLYAREQHDERDGEVYEVIAEEGRGQKLCLDLEGVPDEI